jgi:hypothetical protein
MGSAILISSEEGSVSGVVERVVLSCDGAARELWVRSDRRVKRVPIQAVGVTGWSGQRSLAAEDFEAAPDAA